LAATLRRFALFGYCADRACSVLAPAAERDKSTLKEQIEQAEAEINKLKKQWFFPPYELESSFIKDRTIRIGDLTRGSNIIEGKEFENCSIYGPALVYFDAGCVVAEKLV
jgi:hypothetical protein